MKAFLQDSKAFLEIEKEEEEDDWSRFTDSAFEADSLTMEEDFADSESSDDTETFSVFWCSISLV